MKLYVTHKGRWAGTQDEIKKLGKEDGGWTSVDMPDDKPGRLAWLNGRRVTSPAQPQPVLLAQNAAPAVVEKIVYRESYASQSIAIDEAWENLPLGRKLHFAAMAMEDARQLLNGGK